MNLTIAALCDAATVRDGLLHILGAGPSGVSFPVFPAALSLTLALQFYATPEELKVRHETSITVYNENDEEIAKAVLGFGPGEPVNELPAELQEVSIPIVIPIGAAVLPRPGRYEFKVTLDGALVARLPLLAGQQTVD